MTTETKNYFESKPGLTTLWLGILTGPLVWFASQQLSYLLVYHACASGNYLPLHLVAVVGAGLTLTAGIVAQRNWSRVASAESETELETLRARFMSAMGMMTSGLFALAILAQDIPNFFINACQQ